jgi:hypothetical protein
MEEKRFPFVLHDESVNTQGFRMLTSGADFSAFRSNPVMLLNHNDWELPIGRWENIRTEGSKILADAVFDESDEKALSVMGKVERKFIKAASIGARAIASSSDPAVMLKGQEYPTVTQWKVREASICTIGSNHNALALYDKDDNPIDLSDRNSLIKLFDTTGSNIIPNNSQNMSKVTNLLKLSDSASDEAIAGEVQRIMSLSDQLTVENTALKTDKTALAAKVETYETKEKAARKAESVKLLDAAQQGGRINQSGRAAWESDFENDFDNAKVRLSSIPKQPTVASQVQTGSHQAQGVIALADMTFSDIVKADRLKELKADGNLYREKFYAAYKKYPN